MKKDLHLDETYKLWLLLAQTRAALFSARRRKVKVPIKLNQGTAMVIIWALDGKATMEILSRNLFLERHTVSEFITRLEEKKLVEKTMDAKRKNLIRIGLTDRGKTLCQGIIQSEFVNRIMMLLSAEERQQLKIILSKLFKGALDEMGIKEDVLGLIDDRAIEF